MVSLPHRTPYEKLCASPGIWVAHDPSNPEGVAPLLATPEGVLFFATVAETPPTELVIGFHYEGPIKAMSERTAIPERILFQDRIEMLEGILEQVRDAGLPLSESLRTSINYALNGHA